MKIDFKYKFLIFLITFLIIFGLFFFSTNNSIYISGAFKDIIYFPINLVIKDKKEDIISTSREKELEKEIVELKKTLEIEDNLSSYEIVNSTVINRNTSYWFNQITINKGSKDGIKKGMGVISGNGLVGTIDKVSKTTSTVSLITNNNSKNQISIKISDDDIELNKVMTYSTEDEKLIISGIENDLEIKTGALITTSGLSSIYPSGIIIGTLEEITEDKFAISKKAFVKPSANISNLRFVTVLVRSVKGE